MDVDPILEAWLASSDAIHHAQLRADHPELDELLASPEQHRAVLAWLGGPDALRADNLLVANALSFVRPAATPDDAEAIRPLTLDDDVRVRQAAYDLLLTVYFPDVNRAAMLLVLQAMLTDESPLIRVSGADFVERADAQAELGPYLRRWLDRTARRRGPEDADAAEEIVSRLLGGGP